MAILSALNATAAGKNVRCHNLADDATYATFPILMLRNNTAHIKVMLRNGGFILDNDKTGRAVNSHAIARRIADSASLVIDPV